MPHALLAASTSRELFAKPTLRERFKLYRGRIE
jgi:hypothetical protein